MYSKSILVLSALAAVQASPLVARQASAVSSVAASVVSAVSSAAVAVPSEATSALNTAPSSMASAMSTSIMSSMMSSPTTPVSSSAMSSMMSSAVSSAAATSGMMTGGESFPLYPCPAGSLLSYATVNMTFPVPLANLTAAAGVFANSSLFGNVTMPVGDNMPGATHVVNIPTTNISLPEVLINATTNATSGAVHWIWNSTATTTAMGLVLSSYQSELSLYDPGFSTTGRVGNSSIAVLFTNACINNQTQGPFVFQNLNGLELSFLSAAAGVNSTFMPPAAPGATTTATAMSTMSMPMSTMMASSMASAASTTST